jgi:cytochrome c oxidase subunit I
MTEIDKTGGDEAARSAAQVARLREVWASPPGWRYWSAVNNTEVGRWYTATAFAFFLFAGALALLVRTQLAVPDNSFLSAQLFNQAFTLHGTAMMFLFAVPIFEAVAILLLPTMLGARDLPFPRLSAFGFWCFLIGGVFVCGSIFFNAAPDSGWFMYPPLTTDPKLTGIGADIWLLGLSFIEVASIAAAVELIVGVLKCRPPGMRINTMPLYCWYVLIVGGMILFAFPPLIAGDILFELERLAGWPFFDATRGGDPLLWQHLFWIFGHPEVYIIFLPSIALMAMLVPTFARRPIVGYSWIVLAAVGTGFLSFGLWVHHMFTTGLPRLGESFFTASSMAIALPSGIQIFCWLATIWYGRPVYRTPFLFILAFFFTFILGGMTGVMVASVPLDTQLHDSYFIVAHFHYVLVGGAVFPLLGAVYYWFPKFTGRMMSERIGRWVAGLLFVAFNFTFFPMHLLGLLGMPRRVYTYQLDMGWGALNMFVSLSTVVLAAGFLLFFVDAIRAARYGEPAGDNPWDAATLEWATASPPPSYNFARLPVVRSANPLWEDDGILPVAGGLRIDRRELLVTTVGSALPEVRESSPCPSIWPFWSALATTALLLGSILTPWAVVWGAVPVTIVLIGWFWPGGSKEDES